MQEHHVTYGNIVANERRDGTACQLFGGHMHHRAILNVTPLADPYRRDIAAQHAVIPDRREGAYFNITDITAVGATQASGWMRGNISLKGRMSAIAIPR